MGIAREYWNPHSDYGESLADPDDIFLVAEAGQGCGTTVVGYAIMKITPLNNSGNLHELAVRHDWRSNGVGRSLVEKLAGMCQERGITSVKMEAQADNSDAVEVYKSME